MADDPGDAPEPAAAAEGSDGASAAAQPDFLVQLKWIHDRVTWTYLAEETEISESTLRAWARGDFPKRNKSKEVRIVDDWAAQNLRGYPGAAGVRRLTDASGPMWDTATHQGVPPAPPPRAADGAAPSTPQSSSAS